MRTLAQSHSSSSATSMARPVSAPCPISACATRIVTVSSGAITTQQVISARPSAARAGNRVSRAERNGKAEGQAAAGGACADEEGTAIEFAAGRHEFPPDFAARRCQNSGAAYSAK